MEISIHSRVNILCYEAMFFRDLQRKLKKLRYS